MKVFLFPGQGSQSVGMGADLFQSDACFRGLVALASELVGADLETICLRGPEKKLVQTRALQPLLVAVSLGYLRHLNERGAHPHMVLGHSLGEITALAAAGVVTPEDAVRIAAKRGELMDKAAPADGAMLAVTTEDPSRLREWLASAQRANPVALANNNAATQVVLSGARAALAACAELIAAEKLGKCRFLPVSGPWHSPFMAEAEAGFHAWLERIPKRPPRLPVLFNITAAREQNVGAIRSLISGALTQPVLWTESMAELRAMNPCHLLEVGPGGVLSGLARANGFGDATRIHRVGNLRGVELAARACAEEPTESCSTLPPLLTSGS